MRGSLSGTLATMGAGVPYAIGAKFAHPDRPVIAFAGDGAMQMNGLAELITIKRYSEQWSDPRLIIAVLHNNDLNQVTWELRAMGGAPEVRGVPDPARHLLRRASPADRPGGHRGRQARRIGPAWDRALAADRPVVLDVRCDPDIPPIPPHADFEQIKDAAEAIIKGDPDAAGVVKKGLRTKAQELSGRGGRQMTRFGYFLSSEEHPPRELVRQARLAEQAGFEALWISDHFHPWLDEQGQSSSCGR